MLLLAAISGKAYPQGSHFANRNEVRAIELDPSGTALWYATGGGLVRLDLTRGVYQVLSRPEGLPSSDLTSLAVLADGRLLAGTTDWGVILRTAGGRWVRAGVFDGLPDERTFHLSLATGAGDPGKHAVWVGTLRGARRFIVQSAFLEPDRASPVTLADYAVYDIAGDSSGAVFFATNGGVWRMDREGGFTRYGSAEGVGSLEVSQVESGPEGGIYIVSGGALSLFTGNVFTRVHPPFEGSAVTALPRLASGAEPLLAAAAAGRIYFMGADRSWREDRNIGEKVISLGPLAPGASRPAAGTERSGIFWPDAEGGYQSLSLPGPLYNDLSRVAVDNRGTVWTSSASDVVPAAQTGLNRYDGQTWQNFTQAGSPLIFNLVSSLGPALDGRIYLGTWFGPSGVGSGGVNILGDNSTADPGDDRWETFRANSSGLTMDVIRGRMAFDTQGGVWVASRVNQDQPGGLDYFDPAQARFTSYSAGLGELDVHTVALDGLGNLWIGYVNRGLAVIPGGFPGGQPVRDIPSFRAAVGETGIVDLAVDGTNRLWIATPAKVVLLNFQEDAADENKFSYTEIKPPSFAGLAVKALAVEGYTAAWFATESGIYRLALTGAQEWKSFDRGNSALASDAVNDLALDPGRSILWAATAAGLSALPLSSGDKEPGKSGKLVVRPNPWRPAQQGWLAVSGMPRFSKVSILTVSGEPVRLFAPRDNPDALFFWDGSNAQGRDCASGVYLIQATGPDGAMFTGKVALVR